MRGISTTWRTNGFPVPSTSERSRPQPSQLQGRSSRVSLTRSCGMTARVAPLWPGWPPALRSPFTFGGFRLNGSSEEGGLLEFDESLPRRARRSAFSDSSSTTLFSSFSIFVCNGAVACAMALSISARSSGSIGGTARSYTSTRQDFSHAGYRLLSSGAKRHSVTGALNAYVGTFRTGGDLRDDRADQRDLDGPRASRAAALTPARTSDPR